MYFFLVIPCVIVIGILAAPKKEEEFIKNLDREEHPLKILYPLCAYIFRMISWGNKADIFGSKDILREIYVDEKPELSRKKQGYKCIATLIMILGLTSFICFAYMYSNKGVLIDGRYLARKPAGEGETEYELFYTGISAEKSDIKIKISEKKLQAEEFEKLKKEAQYYIDKNIFKGKDSAECARGSLNLIKEIPHTSIKIKWSEEDSWIVGVDGALKNAGFTEPVKASLHAVLTYFDMSWDYEKEITVYPPITDPDTDFAKHLDDELSEINTDTQTEALFELPDNLDGVEIGWSEQEDNKPKFIIVFGLIAAGIILPSMKQDIKKKQKIRSEQMMRDYPDIISKFVMLITAGMTCRAAWYKICNDYTRTKEKQEKGSKVPGSKGKREKFRYAYEEMLIAQKEMDLGIPEIKVYERFGNRCSVPAYNRFGNLLARNIKRGSAGIIEILESESKESFAERRENVRKKGEETGTKLLIPMFGMLILVIAIVVVPAFSSFSL